MTGALVVLSLLDLGEGAEWILVPVWTWRLHYKFQPLRTGKLTVPYSEWLYLLSSTCNKLEKKLIITCCTIETVP